MKALIGLGLLLIAATHSPLFADERVLTLEEYAARGKTALNAKSYDRAISAFSAGLKMATESADQDAQTRFLFYSGLAYQLHAETGGDAAMLKRSARYYSRALRLKPDSGATMVNLAKVLDGLGRLDSATQLYKRAIDLDDDRRSFYEKSYAEFLIRHGRAGGAVKYFRDLERRDPQDAKARRVLTRHYLSPDAEWSELRTYLWELALEGDAGRALNIALKSLGLREAPRELEELLTVVAAGLSRQLIGPKRFLASPVAETLRPFSDHETIGEGVVQLFSVYELLAEGWEGGPGRGNPYEGMDFSWWTAGSSRRDPDVGLYRRDAFRLLMRSLGNWYANRDKLWVAGACYETAGTFVPNEIDPAALRDLVELYARNEQIGEIEELAAKYEFVLFEGKGAAYRDSQLEKIYQYHLTLGQLYSHLAKRTGDWGSSDKPNSAIFQLEHAKRIGEQLDRMRRSEDRPLSPAIGGNIVLNDTSYTTQSVETPAAETPAPKTPKKDPHKYHVDPGLVDRLATAYSATGKQERAEAMRVEAAERYQKAGDDRAKRYVLQPVKGEQLKSGYKQRYDKLVAPETRAVQQKAAQPATQQRVQQELRQVVK